MIIHDLVQGSAQWHAHRAKYLNASETPAMLGESKYKTRDQLLHEMATGLTKEVDAGTQRAFDDGHKFEALARPVAENIVGEDLYPVVGTDGIYGASFDGITMGEDIIFEHKTLNDDLRKVMFKVNGERFADLPLMYRAQMEHQLMVSGADKCLFMASSWTETNEVTEYFLISENGNVQYYKLVEERHCWYEPDLELRQRIIEGWKQFKTDLDAYVPRIQVEKVEAETVQALPVPSVVVRGEITASNLSEITPKFDAYLSNIKTELATDQDFADAEANAKNCRETAKRIEALQENIIGQMVSVNEVNSVLENYKNAFNKIGLQLEKAVKEQKESLKTAAIMQAKLDYADFVTELNKGVEVMLSTKLSCPDFASAIKGVKTIASMQSRINDALAAGKTEATTLANNVKTKLAYINETAKGYEHLINVNDLAFADIDYIKLYLSKVKADEDKRKAELEAAIKEKAEADARAKLEAEAKAKLDAEANAIAEQASSAASTVHDHWPVVDASFDENDFNNVFEGSANLSATVASVSVSDNNTVASNITATQLTGKRPTAQAIINLVATTYKVDANTASRWLAQSFGELKAA